MDETTDDCPTCDKCGVPITTGMLPLFCPHGRACEFVDDDEHWSTVEELRQDLGIERVVLPRDNLERAVNQRSESRGMGK